MDVLTPHSLDEALPPEGGATGRALRPGRHRRARRAQLRPLAAAGADQPQRGGRAARLSRARTARSCSEPGSPTPRRCRRRRGARCPPWRRRRARSARRRSATAARSAATSARPRRPATRCRRCSSRTREVEIASVRGERRVPLDEFLVGPKQNALAPDELVVAVRVDAERLAADVHEGRPAERDGDLRLLARPRRSIASAASSAPRSARPAPTVAARHGAARRGRGFPDARRCGREPDRRRARHGRLSPSCAARADAAGAGAVPRMKIALTVNGERREADVWGGESLLFALRERLGLPGSKNACEQGECGSCSVLLDGVARLLLPRPRRAGRRSRGRHGRGAGARTGTAAPRAGGVRRRRRRPVRVLHARARRRHRRPARRTSRARRDDEIREALSGNLCRCTGYQKIFDAVRRGGAGMTSTATPPRGEARGRAGRRGRAAGRTGRRR